MYTVTHKTSLSLKGWVKNELRKLWEMFRGPRICTNNNVEVLIFTLPISEADAEILRSRKVVEEEIERLMGVPSIVGTQ